MGCWNITAELDREASERVGAGGTFQVVSLIDDDDNDLTDLVNQGVHFHSIDELKQAIIRGFTERLEVKEVVED